MRGPPRDFTPFADKMPWDERFALIKRSFRSADLMAAESPECEASWRKAFDRDDSLLFQIVKDIFKSDQAQPGRPGPRPALDVAKTQPKLDALLGRDYADRPYALLPFPQAFSALVGKRTVRHVSTITGLPKSQVFRLLKGEITPTSEVMVRVAQGFKKKPSFFLEWRIGAVASAIVSKLSAAPEKSIPTYESLFWEKNK